MVSGGHEAGERDYIGERESLLSISLVILIIALHGR